MQCERAKVRVRLWNVIGVEVKVTRHTFALAPRTQTPRAQVHDAAIAMVEPMVPKSAPAKEEESTSHPSRE